VWPDERVARLVIDNFIAARVHPKEGQQDFRRFSKKYGANWTPTILFLDSEGAEQYRIEGFLPVDDFLAHLTLGLGHTAFRAGQFSEAERQFNSVLQQFPDTDVAAEAQYWAGVSRYKGGDKNALAETALAFDRRYQGTNWAKKASIWKPQQAVSGRPA
jgi:hypothetical protein